jgi:hypothetical protein
MQDYQTMKSITKAEYWLLDLVCDGSFPLYRLTHPDLELIANRDGHGLSKADLLETLHKLFQEGSLICVQYPDDETIVEVVPTYQEIDVALQGKDYVQYRLTIKGGEEWEQLSNPDWNWFVGNSYPNNEVIIEARFCQIAEQYLQVIPYFNIVEVISKSIRYKTLTPWHVTYWKTLPDGHELYAQTRDPQHIKLQQDMSPQEREFLKHVWNWYTNPFKT